MNLALNAEQNDVLRYKLQDDKIYRLPLVELNTNKSTLALSWHREFFSRGKGHPETKKVGNPWSTKIFTKFSKNYTAFSFS